MEQMMNTDHHHQQREEHQSSLSDPVLLDSDEGVIEEVKP
jgi:hypothetical protein